MISFIDGPVWHMHVIVQVGYQLKGGPAFLSLGPPTLGERVGKIISSFFFSFLISKGCLVLTDKKLKIYVKICMSKKVCVILFKN